MTRRIVVMTLVACLPRLLKWVKREAKFRRLRAEVHAGAATFPRQEPQDDLKEAGTILPRVREGGGGRR